MFQPCFLAVEKKERMSAKSVAPSGERKPPEIFCRSFIMPVAFGLIVGEGNRRIVKEAQRVLFAGCETQEEIMSGSARRTAASLHCGGRQRHLGLMEGQPLGDNGVVTALTTFDQLRLQRNALFSRSVRGVTRAAQQSLHFARPRLFLDLDESLQFAQMMGIAQGVQHALHRVVETMGRAAKRAPSPRTSTPMEVRMPQADELEPVSRSVPAGRDACRRHRVEPVELACCGDRAGGRSPAAQEDRAGRDGVTAPSASLARRGDPERSHHRADHRRVRGRPRRVLAGAMVDRATVSRPTSFIRPASRCRASTSGPRRTDSTRRC